MRNDIKLKIRRATVHDREASVRRNFLLATESEGKTLPRQLLRDRVEYILLNPHLAEYFLVCDGWKDVGQFMLFPEPNDWHGSMLWVDNIFIDPPARRQGYCTEARRRTKQRLVAASAVSSTGARTGDGTDPRPFPGSRLLRTIQR